MKGPEVLDWADWRKSGLAGGCVTVLALLVFGVWASTAPLEGAVIAPGVVSTDTGRVKVQHLEGGYVTSLSVREGAVVHAGQPLMSVGNVGSASNHRAVSGQLWALSAEASRLEAQLVGASLPVFEVDVPTSIASEQISLMAAIEADIVGQEGVLHDLRMQSAAEAEGVAGKLEIVARQIESFEAELKSLQPLVDQGITPASELRRLERVVRDLRSGQMDLLSDKSRITAAIAEIGRRIELVRLSFRREAATRLSAVRLEIATTSQRLSVAMDVIGREAVTAPVAGRVIGLSVNGAGQVVAPGAQLLEIVPGDEELVVVGRLDPAVVADVTVGDEVEIRVYHPARKLDDLVIGHVQSVSADVTFDDRTGLSYFEVTTSLPAGSPSVGPGMHAEIVIPTIERTALEYLIQPLSDAVRSGMRER